MIAQRYHWTPVVEFHTAFGAPVVWTPTIPPDDRRLLRCRLILEELMEFMEASGFKLECHPVDGPVITDANTHPYDCVAAADALADLKYVVEGAALEWGIPLQACFLEVHDSNMSKLGEDGRPILREDGKVLKGPGFRPPDLAAVMQRMVEEKPEVVDLAEAMAAMQKGPEAHQS